MESIVLDPIVLAGAVTAVEEEEDASIHSEVALKCKPE